MRHFHAYSVLFVALSILSPVFLWGQSPLVKKGIQSLVQNSARNEAAIINSLTREIGDAALANASLRHFSDMTRSELSRSGLSQMTTQDLEQLFLQNPILQNHLYQQFFSARNELRVSVRPDFNSAIDSLPKMPTRMGRLVLFLDAGKADFPDVSAFLSELKTTYSANIYILSYGNSGRSVPLPKPMISALSGDAPVYSMTFAPGHSVNPLLRVGEEKPISLEDFSKQNGFCVISLLSAKSFDVEELRLLKKRLDQSDSESILVVIGKNLSYQAAHPDFFVTQVMDYAPVDPMLGRVFRFDKVEKLLDKKILWNKLTTLSPGLISSFQKGSTQRIIQQVDSRQSANLLGGCVRIISH